MPDSVPMPRLGRDARAKSTRLYTTLDEVKAELRRTVQEVFAGSRFTVQDRLSPFLPSTSANYVNSRAGGGAVGWSLRVGASVLSGLREPGFTGLDWQSGDAFDEKRLPGEAVEGLAFLEELAAREGGLRELEVADSGLRMKFSNLYYRLLRTAQEEVPNAVPLGLAEALKARVITKCPPALMTVMKPIQRAMWRTLEGHPCFRLVGRPIDEWYLQDRLGLSVPLKEGEGLLSGDYSDATNELASWVSEEIALEIARVWRLPDAEAVLLLRSLTGFFIEPPGGGRGEPQRNGQLMGSVTSFPILCIANAALCRHAMEIGEGRPYSLTTLPGCFNGDDVALRMSARSRAVWKAVTSFAGLSESIGKTYFSPLFVEMNSRLFLMREQPLPVLRKTVADGPEELHDSHLEAVPFVNAGLMYGQKRSGRLSESDIAGSEDAYRPSAGACATDLVETAPTGLRDRAMREFIRLNRPWLEKVKVPWYAPRWLGGVGLPAWEDGDVTHGMTELDLAKAKYILLNWSKKRPTLGSDAEWKLHELALKKLPKPLNVDEAVLSDEQRRDSDRLYGDAVLACLFDSTLSARDMWVEGLANKRSLKSLSKNTSLWSKAKPLAPDDKTLEVVFGRRGTRMVEYWPVRFRNEERQAAQRFSAFDLEILADLEQFESSGLLARVSHQGPADSL